MSVDSSSYPSAFFSQCCADHRDLHSFPTRRSSDLAARDAEDDVGAVTVVGDGLRELERPVAEIVPRHDLLRRHRASLDRKSTRLNSSHPSISYAVFCLKKNNITTLINVHSTF